MPPKRSATSPATKKGASKRQKTTDNPIPVVPAADAPSSEAPEEQPEPVEPEDNDDNAPITKGAKATKAKAVLTKPPPVRDCFVPFETKPTLVVPAVSDFWGIKPVTGDQRPHSNQPAARDSDGATNPAMWEDRKFRFKRGSRYVTYFGPVAPEGADAEDAEELDQEDLLLIPLMDMRPKSKHDQTPRRTPTYYCFDAGTPKDWNDKQAIKALNDRRGQAIDRNTLDAPWQAAEREYLAQLLREQPDASIWELAELHNDHFMGNEFVETTGFSFAQRSSGRTVESVRHEYVTYKPNYDNGEAPTNVRNKVDKSADGKALAAAKEKTFGKPDTKLAKAFDDAAGGGSDDESGDEGEKKTSKPARKKAAPKTAAAPKKTKKSPAKESKAMDAEEIEAANRMAAQPRIAEDDEELLLLAGLDDLEQIRSSLTPSLRSAIRSPARRRQVLSMSSDSDLSDVPSNLSSPVSSSRKRKTPAAAAPAPAKRVRIVEPIADDDNATFEQALASFDEEVVAVVVAEQTVVTGETVVEETVVVEQQEVKATPSPKAVRAVEIDDNYDDEELDSLFGDDKL
jgi:hypothetical protein